MTLTAVSSADIEYDELVFVADSPRDVKNLAALKEVFAQDIEVGTVTVINADEGKMVLRALVIDQTGYTPMGIKFVFIAHAFAVNREFLVNPIAFK